MNNVTYVVRVHYQLVARRAEDCFYTYTTNLPWRASLLSAQDVVSKHVSCRAVVISLEIAVAHSWDMEGDNAD